MSRLETPLKEVLRDVTTEASVARMWNRIEARGRVGTRAPLRGFASAHRLALAAALLLVVGGVLALVTQSRREPLSSVSVSAHVGELALANGLPLSIGPGSEHTAPLALSDGSTLVLEEGAAIEVVENSATAVRLKQSRGNVLYDIKPGGPRRWTIEYGIVTVEVIGTSFRVEHAGPLLRVEVMRGTVLVRGEGVPGHAAQLNAGMKVEIADPPSSPPSPAPASTDPPPPSSSLAPSPSSGSRPDGAAWRELARRGENGKAYAELGSAGVARAARTASVDDLLTLADVARLSGHPADAEVPLERLVTEHAADSRASLAAFTLGRVRLDSLHAPAAAARAFEKAIALGVPGGLAEDAYAHLAEARAKAGDEAGAKAAFGEYVRRFPKGARRAELGRLVGVTTDPER